MRTIYYNSTGYGNVWYRATGDLRKVNIQRKNGGTSTWKTLETIRREVFDERARYFDIYNPYNQNPAHMLKIIRSINGECDFQHEEF